MGKIPYRESAYTLGIGLAIVLAMFLAGGATTSPEARFTKALPNQQRVDANDTVLVNAQAGQGVAVEEGEKQRSSQRIKEKIDVQKLHGAEPDCASGEDVQ